MVFQDISAPVELNKVGRAKSPAQMLDRFFSFVIDFLFIFPITTFSVYIVFNDGFQFLRTNPTAPENVIFETIVRITSVLVFALIQTYFVSIWSATPGQYFLKIRFEFEDNESGRMIKIFLRQILFWVSLLFLGIPYLAVLADKKRRTFYDKMCGVHVVSLKSENIVVGFENEYKYWQAFMTTLSLFYAFFIGVMLYTNYKSFSGRLISFNEFKSRNYFCEDLATVDIDTRLETAVALNLVDQLSDSCLDREANFVLWRQRNVDTSLAYYAKSLTAETKEKEQSYLSQACEGQEITDPEKMTKGCKIASAFKENKIEEFFTELRPGSILNDVLKYELSKIFNESVRDDDKFNRLQAYNELKGIKKYRLNELVARIVNNNNYKPNQVVVELPEVAQVHELNKLNYEDIENRKLILTEFNKSSEGSSEPLNSDTSTVATDRKPASFVNDGGVKNTSTLEDSAEELLQLVNEL